MGDNAMPTGILQGFAAKIVALIFGGLIGDSAALRACAQKLLGTLETLAARTESTIDDLFVKALGYVVADDEAWAFCYARINVIYHAIVDGDESGSTPDVVRLTADAEEAGLDPALIVTFITVIVEVLKWWRSRKS
jgi:hypothetical protein